MEGCVSGGDAVRGCGKGESGTDSMGDVGKANEGDGENGSRRVGGSV